MNYKQLAAQAALEFVNPDITVVGVGSGSTVNEFIKALVAIKPRIDACVAASQASANLLREHGFVVWDLNVVDGLALYIDGADVVSPQRVLLKGGGGALAREKVLASAASQFVTIVDYTKLHADLTSYPVVVEVLPMARSFVARQILRLGGDPVYRDGYVTDNGNVILDVHSLEVTDAQDMECQLSCIPGVVANGIFAKRRPDDVIVAEKSGKLDIF